MFVRRGLILEYLRLAWNVVGVVVLASAAISARSVAWPGSAWVGLTGRAYGVDMTDDMLTLARANAAKAGATNVEFLKGEIEAVPLPDASVDVVISNCVINLSTDKPAALAEMFRVLVPGGRIGISDVVAEDHMTPADRAATGSSVGCIAGALSRSQYVDGLAAAGFTNASVTLTNEAAPGMSSAIIRAIKPSVI